MNVIRRATQTDVPAIMNLLVQVNMTHHIGRPDLFKGPTTKYSETELCAIFNNDATPVFVSVSEDNVIQGHAFCVVKVVENDRLLVDCKTLYIDDICVDVKCRGKGVGRGLYEHVLQYAKSIGCYNVTLNVWTCNPTAMKFYEKCGLVPQKVGMEKIL
ncbi:MAG: GNAT family N-acetyltransferase [Planctomycetia bacterium]|nr:GNAT family N-acetyltransferase [Planctomycetia bacterium]